MKLTIIIAVLTATSFLAGEAATHGKLSASALRQKRLRQKDGKGGDKVREADFEHFSPEGAMATAFVSQDPNAVDTSALPVMPTPKPFPGAYNIMPLRCPTGMWRVGCIQDSQTEQQRWYHKTVPKEDRVPMTPEVCYGFCQNSSGAQYFGLTRGDLCYCTPFFHNTDKGGHGECDQPCVGDQVRMCGGMEMVDIYEMHDCNNMPAIPCRRPPPFPEHAKVFESRYYKKTGTPCANAKVNPLTTIDAHCEIECDRGYELTMNDIRCTEKGDRLSYSWSQIMGQAICSPVCCGRPALMPHSMYPALPVYFPNSATYTCQLGFTLDQDPLGPKNHTIDCQWTAEFTNTSECLRVKCGQCPSGGKLHNSTYQEQGIRVYEDLCTYDCHKGFTLDAQANGPKQHATTCLATGEFSEPKECMPVECGPAMKLPWMDFVIPPGGTRNDTIVYPEIVTYDCDKGYSLTGIYGDATQFTVTCQHDGMFSTPQVCKPNLCGPPPLVRNSVYATRSLVYKESVTYTCDIGYTLTGKAGDIDYKTIMCGWNGQFAQKAPLCKPVECGPVLKVSEMKLQGHASYPPMWTFADPPLDYTCDPGYSTDVLDSPWVRRAENVSTFCEPTGMFAYFAPAVNIDDCKRHNCGPNGQCVDEPNPTGVPFDDYHCHCDPGYEETLYNGSHPEKEKHCTNINDCPRVATCGGINARGVKRGVCQDLLINYTCNCGSGYLNTLNTSIPGGNNLTCNPVVCGPAPIVQHATHDAGSSPLNYDTEPWTYTCDTGYSLTGIYGGSIGFEARCLASANFSQLQDCLPVTCGEPFSEPYADADPQVPEAFFPEVITYTCIEGYSLNHKYGGPTVTTIDCQADGTLSNLKPCHPVECGTIPHHIHAKYNKTHVFVFKDAPKIECETGYSLDQTTAPISKSYRLNCLSDGQYEPPKKCKPVLCGPAPKIPHTTVTAAARVYLESSTYQLDTGYTLDATPGGAKSFDITCQADATFTPAVPVLPVDCGPAPVMENTTYPGTSHVFPTKAQYTCLTGYSLDGKFGGPTTFEKACQADGTYDGTDECKPVECGAPNTPNNSAQIAGWAGLKLGTLTFGQYARYECDPGWSFDAKLNSTFIKGNARCTANGTVIYPLPCLNMDDCAAPDNQCATNGMCLDNQNPTGVHVDDYHCHCDSGYRENISDTGSHYCYNIDDVPDPSGPVEWQVDKMDVSGMTFTKNSSGAQNSYDAYALLPGVWGITVMAKQSNHHVRIGLTSIPTASHGYPGGKYFGLYPNGRVYIPGRSDDNYNVHDEFTISLDIYDKDDWALYKNGQKIHSWNGAPRKNVDMFAKIFAYEQGAAVEVTRLERPGCAPGSGLDEVNTYSCQCATGFHAGHNCQPVICGAPLVVPHAGNPNGIVPEANFSTLPMEYECDLGYTLDGAAQGNRLFDLSCLGNGSISYPPTCFPVRCGAAPHVNHAVYPTTGTFVFPQKINYNCRTGYSIDAVYDQSMANTKFQTECLSNGSFAVIPTCEPVKCPGIPSQPNVVTDMGGTNLVYPQDVSEDCMSGYALHKDQHQRASYTISCDDKGALQYSEGKDRCVPISCGAFPNVPYGTTSGSDIYTGTAKVQCKTGYSTDRTPIKAAAKYNFNCQADGTYTATPPCKRILCGVAPKVNNATRSSSAQQYYTDKVTYTLQNGFTLNGKHNGPKSFRITCQANGQFTSTKLPKPVQCGAAPMKSYATNPMKRRVYPQQEPYTCLNGYSVDGTASGAKSFKITCTPSGQYQGPAGCKPIDCGPIPTPPNAQKTSKANSLVFPQRSQFECLPGYSLDGTMEGNTKFQTRCRANGKHSVHPGCKNKDDCEGHKCSPNGKCVDNITPTGVHKDDYHCVCDDGFEEEIADDGTRSCANIPDCPPDACLPGTCHDLVNDYKCQCPPGYYEGPNPAEQLAHDCLGVSCGIAPVVKHATTNMTGQDIRFDMAPVEYECDTGYTLSGYAGGAFEFNITCQADKSFTAAPVCKPVSVGFPTPVTNATYQATREYFYPEDIDYTCDKGHTVDGTASGASSFKAKAMADGTITGVLPCDPVECPTATTPGTFGPNANFNAATAAGLVYPNILDVTCLPGYALDKDVHQDIKYGVQCQHDGTLMVPNVACTEIDCGSLPTVANADVTGSSLYGGVVTATAKAGWSLDGSTAATQLDFDFTCETSGSFTSPLPVFQKVKCGVAPSVSKTTRDTLPKVYQDVVQYTLDTGYTLDGTATGDKSFDITCQDDGTFTAVQTPQPVLCGAPPPRPNAISAGTGFTYTQSVTYTCNGGHTLNAQASGGKSFTEKCQADGTFTQQVTAGCLPVDCGTLQQPPFTTQKKDRKGNKLTSLVFGDEAWFECNKGYSKDGIFGSKNIKFKVSCLASGSFNVPATCKNVNDCAGPANQCNKRGKCVDKANPTGNHFQDFSCKCNSGFKEVKKFGVRKCENIDDCPKRACRPGSCTDLINDYECVCPRGYYQDANPAKNLPHDCLPNSCGMPPTLPNAKTIMAGKNILYNMPSVEYICDKGYTLDQSPTGDDDFTISCKWNKQFETPLVCLPVECPAPPMAFASLQNGNTFNYTQQAEYKCDLGHYVGGNPSGLDVIKSECQHDGTMAQVYACGSLDKVSGGGATWTSKASIGSLSLSSEPPALSSSSGITHAPTPLPTAAAPWQLKIEFTPPIKIHVAVFNNSLNPADTSDYSAGMNHQLAVAGWTRETAPGLTGAANGAVPSHNLLLWSRFFTTGTYTLIGGLNGTLSATVLEECTSSLACNRAKCPGPATQDEWGPHTTYDPIAATNLVYGRKIKLTCLPGYSLDKDDLTDIDYEVGCDENGRHIVPNVKCVPIDCGSIPNVCHGSFLGTSRFGSRIIYTADPGYSVDGTNAQASKIFNVTCQADGTFSAPQTFQRIDAGPAPTVAHIASSTFMACQVPKCVAGTHGNAVVPVTNWLGLDNGMGTVVASLKKFPSGDMCYPAGDAKLQNAWQWDFSSCPGGCNFNGPWTVDLDFGKSCTVAGFKYDDRFGATGNKIPTAWRLMASADGITWREVFKAVDVNAIKSNGVASVTFPPTNAQYWQWKVDAGLCPKIEVFDIKASCNEPVTLATMKVVTKSVVMGGNHRGGASRGLSVHRVASLVQMQHHEVQQARVAALANRTGVVMKKLPSTLKYCDAVKYTCATGYRAAISNNGIVYPADPQDFTVTAGDDGDLELTSPAALIATACRPMSCLVTDVPGDKKTPVFASPVNQVLLNFKDKQPYRCVQGFSLDGTPSGTVDFTEDCQADSTMSAVNTCTKINWCLLSQCEVNGGGSCVDGKMSYTCTCDPGYKVDIAQGGLETCVEIDECVTQSGHARCAGTTGDAGICDNKLEAYNCSCDTGYENTLRTDGTDSCTPVECPTLPIRPKAMSSRQGAKLTYEQKATYTCKAGYTLSGVAGTPISYEVECLANKSYTPFLECLPVDCGQLQGVSNSSVTTAFAISLTGFSATASSGRTIEVVDHVPAVGDKTFTDRTYTFSSLGDFATKDVYYIRPPNDDKGANPAGIMWSFNSPVNCTIYLDLWGGAAHEQLGLSSWLGTWTKTSMTGTAFSGYGPGVVYKRDYTAGAINIYGNGGNPHGAFVVFAEPNPTPGPSYDPDAGQTPPSASLLSVNIVFGQFATYQCDNGHTIGGAPSAADAFDVTCDVTGSQSTYDSCDPVVCGVPPQVLHALSNTASVSFPTVTTYTCKTGYTIDGTSTGNTTFDVSCAADGTFQGAKSCMPVSCGVPAKIQNAQMPMTSLVFQQQFQAVCDSGYTVDHDPQGQSTFTVTCGANGNFTGLQKCLPVTCGTPVASTTSDSTDTAKFLGQDATWNCKAGYSLDGMKNGATTYTRTCMASGAYGTIAPVPAGCIDIDFCAGNPCSANGVCIDDGPGVVNPGYNCSCNQGYEIKQRSDGTGPKCDADDCHNSPCGVGGTCTDLSKSGGAPGQYKCECELGYDLDETDPNKPTCVRVVCGALPSNIANVVLTSNGDPDITTNTWKGAASQISALTSTPILNSYDTATWRCARGYSTDGSTSKGSKTFTVKCMPFGQLNRVLQPHAECQPVRCDNWQRPMIPSSFVINAKQNFYQYGDVLKFKCNTGYSTTGLVGGPQRFDVPCQADGTFPQKHPNCVAVQCPVLVHQMSVPSAVGMVNYATTVTYKCDNGCKLGGVGPATYGGQCGANGAVALTDPRRCKPAKCGVIPQQPNAQMYVAQNMLSSLNLLETGAHTGVRVDEDGELMDRDRVLAEAPVYYDSSFGKRGGTNLPTCGGDCDKDSDCANGGYCFQRSGFTPVPGCRGDSRSSFDYCAAPLAGPKSQDAIHAAISGNFVLRQGYVELPGPPMTNCRGSSCGGFVQFRLRCTVSRSVSFEVETISPDKKSDSFFLQVGNGKQEDWNVGTRSSWGWSSSKSYYVTKGVQSLRLYGREDGISIRKIQIKGAATKMCSFLPPPTMVKVPTGSKANFHSPAILVNCTPGMTVGGIPGGLTFYMLSCMANGQFSPVTAQCDVPKFPVTGIISDAQSDTTFLAGASVSFIQNGQVVASATTIGGGRYSVKVPPGLVTMRVTHTGYIASQKNITLNGPVTAGQGADMPLSAVLPPGQWRFVVTWGAVSTDLDTHLWFGAANLHPYYGRRTAYDAVTGQSVEIDVDDVTSYGPETVTVKNAKGCVGGQRCLIKYAIHNYADYSGTLGNSKAVIKIYHGTSMVKRYEIPASVGTHRWYRVFTLDTETDQIYDGDWDAPPSIDGVATYLDWATSFNYARWSLAPSQCVLFGLGASSLAALHAIDSAEYYYVEDATGWSCTTVDWQPIMSSSAGNWAMCPQGYHLNGLLRSGTRYDLSTGVDQLEKAQCCRPTTVRAEWGTCIEEDFFKNVGASRCPNLPNGKPTALVGLHKKQQNFVASPVPMPTERISVDNFPLMHRSGKCIHPDGGSDRPGNDVALVTHDGCDQNRRALVMRMIATGGEFFMLQHWSDKCVVPNGGSDTPRSGTNLVWGPGCAPTRKALQFRRVMIDSDNFMLQHYAGYCVTASGNNPRNNDKIVLKGCNKNSKNQHFQALRTPKVVNGNQIHLRNQYQSRGCGNKAWLDTNGGGCQGNVYCVSSCHSRDRAGAGTGTWEIIKKDGKSGPIMHGDVVYLKNQYGSKPYLDTRGGGCWWDPLCVSTASSNSRDGASGEWQVERYTGFGSVRELDFVHLRNGYHPRPYLNTKGCQRRRGMYYVSAAHSKFRDGWVGTWQVYLKSGTAPPPKPTQAVYDGTMVDAVHAKLNNFVVEQYYVKLPGPRATGCRGASCSGSMEFNIDCSAATTVSFRAEVISPDSHSDSFYLQVNSGSQQAWSTGQFSDWRLSEVSPQANANQGINTVLVKGKEDHIKVRSLRLLAGAGKCKFVTPRAEKPKIEVGTVKVTAAKQFFGLKTTFANPKVFIVTNHKGGDPAKIRVQNVVATGFEATIVEPSGMDGPHAGPMVVTYIAAEPGVYTLPDGTKLEVGSFDMTEEVAANGCRGQGQVDSWRTVTFRQTFPGTPVMITGLQTMNSFNSIAGIQVDDEWMTVATDEITATEASMALERGKASNSGSGIQSEEVAYLAIEASSGTLIATDGNSVEYVALTSSASINGWSDPASRVNFGKNLGTSSPQVVVSKNSRNGGDGGWVRMTKTDANWIEVKIDEDTNCGTPRTHPASEKVGVLAFSRTFTTVLALPMINKGKCCAMTEKVLIWKQHANSDCGGTPINAWADGTSSGYGQGYVNNIPGCQATCADHADCKGFTVDGNTCSYWKSGPLGVASASGKTCYEKQDQNLPKLLPGTPRSYP